MNNCRGKIAITPSLSVMRLLKIRVLPFQWWWSMAGAGQPSQRPSRAIFWPKRKGWRHCARLVVDRTRKYLTCLIITGLMFISILTMQRVRPDMLFHDGFLSTPKMTLAQKLLHLHWP